MVHYTHLTPCGTASEGATIPPRPVPTPLLEDAKPKETTTTPNPPVPLKVKATRVPPVKGATKAEEDLATRGDVAEGSCVG